MKGRTRAARVGLVAALAAAPAAGDFALRPVVQTGDDAPGVPGGVFARFGEPVSDRDGGVSFRGLLEIGPGGVTGDDAEGIWSESGAGLALVARQGQPAPGAPPGAVFESFYWMLRDDGGDVTWVADLRIGPGGIGPLDDRGLWKGSPGDVAAVIREGDPVAGAGGLPIESLGIPRVSDAGEIALAGALDATLTSDGQALWSDDGGGAALALRVGDAAPGAGPGAAFGALMNPTRNAAGIAFHALLRPGAGGVTLSNERGVWAGMPDALQLVARSGDAAPGVPGAVFHRFSVFPAHSEAGEVAFQGRLRPGVGGVTLADEWGLWAGEPGGLELVAREGDAAPGAPPGAVFGVFYAPVLSVSGAVAFQARLAPGPGGVTHSNDRGIWTDAAGSLERVALEGDVPPGVPGGEFYRLPGVPELNDAGYLAFLAELRDQPASDEARSAPSSTGIWLRDPAGGIRLVARSGLPLALGPGDTPTVAGLELVAGSGGSDGRGRSLADDGRLVFRAAFTDGREAVLPEPGAPGSLGAGALLLAALSLRRRRDRAGPLPRREALAGDRGGR